MEEIQLVITTLIKGNVYIDNFENTVQSFGCLHNSVAMLKFNAHEG